MDGLLFTTMTWLSLEITSSLFGLDGKYVSLSPCLTDRHHYHLLRGKCGMFICIANVLSNVKLVQNWLSRIVDYHNCGFFHVLYSRIDLSCWLLAQSFRFTNHLPLPYARIFGCLLHVIGVG